nr:hypothetical protein [Tanacetum cinerariifolium]
NTNKAAFKAQHWVIDPTTGTYNVEKIRRERPENITASEGISILSFGMIPGTLPEPLKIGKTGQRARSYLDRDPGRLLAFQMRWENVPPWHLILDWKIRGTHLFAGDCRWGMNPLRAFPSDVSPATSRPGKESPATSRRGKPQIVAGENT